MTTRVKGWSKFQHFKDRKPPWIKLYRDILDDMEWHELDPVAAKALVMIWLIASENDGDLPPLKTLAFRLRMSEKQAESVVSKLGHWLERPDINTISTRYQCDRLETETEEETERETEKPAAPAPFSLPDWINKNHWNAWHGGAKRRKATAEQKQMAIDKLAAWREAGQDYAGALENAAVGGWQGLFLPDKGKALPTATVQARAGPDPELTRLEADRKKAVPMPAAIAEQIARLKNMGVKA